MSAPRFCILIALLVVLPVAAQQQQTGAPVAPVESQTPATAGPDVPLHVGGSVVPPTVLHHVEPEFSEEARHKKFSGTVRVSLIVEKDGSVTHVRVVQGVGHGLDEKAVEAVQQYRFNPARRDGEPVRVDLYIDISFQIHNKRNP